MRFVFRLPLVSYQLLLVTSAVAADEPCSAKPHFNHGQTSVRLPGVRRTGNRVLVSVRINGSKEDLLFIFDTGAGGFGQSQTGVVGPNEWFRIGNSTIPATQSACCAGNDDVNRQLGAAVLSQFRITFNYPAHSVIFDKY